MRNVIFVPEQQLKRVRSGRQVEFDLGLSGAEMQMIEIGGDGFVEPRKLGVDQEVMVPRTFTVGAGRSNSHSAQSKVNHGLRRNRGAVLEVDEVDRGAGWRRDRTAGGLGLRGSGADR